MRSVIRKNWRFVVKYILLLTFCLLFNTYAFTQINQAKAGGDVGVAEIFLAKADAGGEPGEAAENFAPTDVPIFCVVQLDSMKSAIVKMNLVAVKVGGVKPDTKVFTVSYTTNGEQSRVSFKGAPDGKWVAGNYRFDIYINGKPAGTKTFEILSAAKPVGVEKNRAKSAAAATLGKKFRRN